MLELDAKGKFGNDYVLQFLEKVKEDDIIIFVRNEECIGACNKAQFQDTFKSDVIVNDAKAHPNDEYAIATEEVEIKLNSADITWWNENSRRLSKLFATNTSKPAKVYEKPQPQHYNVAVGIAFNGRIIDIKTSNCDKKELIAFINSQNEYRLLSSFMQADIMVCFDYNSSKDDVWKSIQQWADEGVIEL